MEERPNAPASGSETGPGLGSNAGIVREVVRCRNCGLCRGVRRALDLALGLAGAGWNVFTDGELVHNPGVLRDLAGRGVRVWDGEERSWGPRDCILIRAHGIGPERRAFLLRLGCPLFDGTCPEVARVAGKIRRGKFHGRGLLLFGDGEHPETRGLMAHGGENLRVVRDSSDLDRLGDFTERQPFLLLAQTTADEGEFAELGRDLLQRFPASQIDDTICASTRIRRAELDQLLQNCPFDAVVVLGGLHSANTLRLAAAARAAGLWTLHAEDAAALAETVPFSAMRVLLASGTSTPEEVVDAAERALRGHFSCPGPGGDSAFPEARAQD
ncbi:MAG: hypothetical protein LBT98_04540 [Puniceicoccales bacterium]|nr:hypothetical protein [Puniceicoccales bacterium]